MQEDNLFVKVDKHKELMELMKKIEATKEQTSQKIELVKEIIDKEKKLLDEFEDSLKNMDNQLNKARALLNSDH